LFVTFFDWIHALSTLRRSLAFLLLLSFLLSACGSPSTPVVATATQTESQPTPVADAPQGIPVQPAFETGVYPNLFRDYLGKSDEEIQAKIDAAWEQLFYGDDATERVYYPVGADMAYISDIANDDVRSEGMSYGMMIAVQLNKKEEFDRLWKWAKTYMYQTEGGYKGYFAWHCKTDGTQLAANPASDGEVWFITALFFADGRWGSGEGIYNYRAEAQSILDTALHDENRGDLATDLFDPETKQVVFVPQMGQNSQFTDPSYHMPHFYELWARWADKDNDFWADAAIASREYLPKAVHPETGLAPNYSYFDGKPYNDEYNGNFRYDAFRVGANVGMDYVWFAPGEWHVEQSNRLLHFFASQGMNDYKAEYLLTGEPEVGHRSPGLMATNAVAALAADREIGEPFVQALWDQSLPMGQYRYYDGLLMMLGLLQVSGNFRIYEPGTAPAGQVFPTPAPEVEGKFAPLLGKALLLVGQDKESIDAYFDATVTPPGGVAVNIDLPLTGTDELNYLAEKYPNSTLSVGVDLGDSLTATDEQIDALLDGLTAYNRPIFLRLGYGADAVPDEYVSAWKKFHERIQAKGSENVALVWESVSCEESSLADWYPGDESVDWIGVRYECAEATIQFAREHFKPVMLHASSQGASEWFAPFFQFVTDNNDVVRAMMYINTGDSRLSNADSIKNWKTETKKSFWLRANPNLFNDLGYTE
jgi:oligosaccharide reducing-end xylanase